MPEDFSNEENKIYSVFSTNSLPKNTVLGYREFGIGDAKFYVCATLFSSQVPSLSEHLEYGLDYFQQNYNPANQDTLSEMKKVLFGSGDYLADHLLGLKLPVDDVDYSVCFVVIKKGTLYVWMDGDMNLRLYRGTDSLVVNSSREPQFYGSTTVELGDILILSQYRNISDPDIRVEDYVTNQKEPDYPALILDYQVDYVAGEVPSEYVSKEYSESTSAEITIDDDENIEVQSRSVVERSEETPTTSIRQRFENSNIPEKLTNIKSKLSDNYNKLKESGFFDKVKEYSVKTGNVIWSFLMSFTSYILDFFYGLFSGNSPHKLKRFQGSVKKKNLQYLFIAVLLVFLAYFLVFRPLFSGSSSNSGINNSTNSSNSNNDSNTQKTLQDKYNELKQYSLTAQVDKFNQTYQIFKTDIQKARSNGFQNVQFLTDISTQAQELEFTLFKFTKVSKVGPVYVSGNGGNVNIVDFAILGQDIYAIDRTNSAVLKANPSTLQFDVFASDTDLSSMNNIACIQTSCYITDDINGIAVLNLQTKTFSKFLSNSAIKNAGAGVVELEVYLVQNNPNLYTFVPSQGKIIKYAKSGEGFKAGETWNKTSGFSTATSDFAIDGGIFEINSSGALRRFFGGNLETNFAGLEPSLLPLGSKLQIAVTAARATSPNNINRVYIADSENERVVVYQKDLNSNQKYTFLGSYKYTGEDNVSFKDFRQVILSEDEKMLYGLSENKVFAFPVTAI